MKWLGKYRETMRDKRARWKREGLCRKCGEFYGKFTTAYRTIVPRRIFGTLCEECRFGKRACRMRDRRYRDSFSEFIRWLVDSDGEITDERTERFAIRTMKLYHHYHRHDHDDDDS